MMKNNVGIGTSLTQKLQEGKVSPLALDRMFQLGVLSQKMIVAECNDNHPDFARAFLEYIDIKRELRRTKITSEIVESRLIMIETFAAYYLGENTVAPYRDR